MSTVNFTIENSNGLLSGETNFDFDTIMRDFILNDNSVKELIRDKMMSIVKSIDSKKISDKFQGQLTTIFNLSQNDVKKFQEGINKVYAKGVEKLEESIERSIANFKFDVPKIKVEDIRVNPVSIDALSDNSIYGSTNPNRKEENLYANEEITTKVAIVDISDDTLKKLEGIMDYQKSPLSIKPIENREDNDSFVYTLAGLGIAAIAAKKMADWIVDQDLKEFWKILFGFITDSKYRKVFTDIIETKFSKFTAFFGDKFDDLVKGINKSFGNFFDNNKVLNRVKNSEWLSDIMKTFDRIGDQLDNAKMIFKESIFGKTFTEFSDKFKFIFTGIKEWFNIGGNIISDASKTVGNVGDVVKGGGIMAQFSTIGKYIASTNIGKFVGVLAKPGASLAKGTFKFIPILGDILSIYIGYDRLKNSTGYLDVFQGLMDIVSGVAGLTVVGQPISFALDAINLVIDLMRWGTKEVKEYVVSQGKDGVLDLIADKFKGWGRQMMTGLINLMPSFISDMFVVNDDSSITFKGVDFVLSKLDDATGGVITGMIDGANKVKQKAKSATNWISNKFGGLFDDELYETSVSPITNSPETPESYQYSEPKPKKTEDIIIDSGRVTYYQPEKSDKLINVSENTNTFAKSDGFLDKKFEQMIKILKDQVTVTVESGNNLIKIHRAILESVDELVRMNGVLPALAPLPPPSPTTQFSEDSSDPVGEYRRRNYNMRGV